MFDANLPMLCGSPFYSTRHNLLALPSPQPEPVKPPTKDLLDHQDASHPDVTQAAALPPPVENMVLDAGVTVRAGGAMAAAMAIARAALQAVKANATPVVVVAPAAAAAAAVIPAVSKRLDVDDVALMQQVG